MGNGSQRETTASGEPQAGLGKDKPLTPDLRARSVAAGKGSGFEALALEVGRQLARPLDQEGTALREECSLNAAEILNNTERGLFSGLLGWILVTGGCSFLLGWAEGVLN